MTFLVRHLTRLRDASQSYSSSFEVLKMSYGRNCKEEVDTKCAETACLITFCNVHVF